MAELVSFETMRAAYDEPISSFADRLFGHLARADQRRWAQLYLQALLTTPGRKSIRRLAATVSSSATAAQSLHQFVNASPWAWSPTRRELAQWAERHVPARARTIDVAVVPKRGKHSCGVHRRFVPATGRTINCQVGLGVFLASDTEHIPVDWRLLLPELWSEDPQRRERARIPEIASCEPLWRHVLHLARAVTSHASAPSLPIVADFADHPGSGALIGGLERLGHDFAVTVPAAFPVRPFHRADPHRGRDNLHEPLSVKELLLRHHRHGATAGHPLRAHGLSLLVGLPGVPRPLRLFVEESAGSPRIWITSLIDADTDHLLGLARLIAGTKAATHTLEQEFGLLDFEGRSFPGWHHHMTLVSAAYAYDRLLRRTGPPAASAASLRYCA